MKAFVKDFNLNQKEIDTITDVLKSIKAIIPIYKRVIEDYGKKNTIQMIISNLSNYMIKEFSKISEDIEKK